MRSLDFTVELFRSAEEFLESSRLQEVSCLVLDVRLPGMSGLQLQRHLAERGYRIPIIFITASPDEGIRAHALDAGAVDFLPKPFNATLLLARIESSLAKKRFHDQETSFVQIGRAHV